MHQHKLGQKKNGKNLLSLCLATGIVALGTLSTGCTQNKSWAPKLPELKLPKIAWGKGLNFGKEKPNKDDLLPPNQYYDPTDMGGSSERLASFEGPGRSRENARDPYAVNTAGKSDFGGGYGQEPVNRDPNLERSPYSRSRRPGSEIASSGNNGFGSSSSYNPSSNPLKPTGNRYGSNPPNSFATNGGQPGNGLIDSSSAYPGSGLNNNLLPKANNPGNHNSQVNSIPGGALPNPTNSGGNGNTFANTLPPMKGFGSTASPTPKNTFQPNNFAGNTGSSSASFPNNGGFNNAGLNSGGLNSGGLNTPGGTNPGFGNTAQSIAAPTNPFGSTNSYQNKPVSGVDNGGTSVRPAAPTFSDTSGMLKPYRPGSTSKPAAPEASKSTLPAYPSTGFGAFQPQNTRTSQKPATSGFGTSSLPPTNFGGTSSSHPIKQSNGMICDGDKCYLPQD